MFSRLYINELNITECGHVPDQARPPAVSGAPSMTERRRVGQSSSFKSALGTHSCALPLLGNALVMPA
jgi:hypothetical protein